LIIIFKYRSLKTNLIVSNVLRAHKALKTNSIKQKVMVQTGAKI
jgi:hypothetical protein